MFQMCWGQNCYGSCIWAHISYTHSESLWYGSTCNTHSRPVVYLSALGYVTHMQHLYLYYMLWDSHNSCRSTSLVDHLGIYLSPVGQVNPYAPALDNLTQNYNVCPTTYNIVRSVACGSTCPKDSKIWLCECFIWVHACNICDGVKMTGGVMCRSKCSKCYRYTPI